MGAEAWFIALFEVHTALDRDIIDSAIAAPGVGFSQRWYEVTDYLVEPIPSVQVSWLTMNRDQWNALPPGFQEIIREEADRHQEQSLRLSTNAWLKQGIQGNIEKGMKYTELTPELQDAFRKAAISTVLPNWVERVGGPSSPEVTYYNQKVAPIVGVQVNPDGTASEIRPAPGATIQTPLVRRPIPVAPEVNFLGTGVERDQLRFDVDQFSVRTGTVVVMTLKNSSQVNQHNWVLVKAGTKDAVASRGTIHPTTYWVQPDDPDVIVHTELVDPRTSVMIRFVAPAAGKYQFVCTFPGHNVTMFGDFEVTQ